MNPTSNNFSIGDSVIFTYHRRDPMGKIYEPLHEWPQKTGIISKIGCDDYPYGYTITFNNGGSHKWVYDQELTRVTS